MNKYIKKLIWPILGVVLVPTLVMGARTDAVWDNFGTYMKTTSPTGLNVLINGLSKYINFNSTVGSGGYGFRDNAGTMEFKDSGGSWAAFGTGSGGGVSDWYKIMNYGVQMLTPTTTIPVFSEGGFYASSTSVLHNTEIADGGDLTFFGGNIIMGTGGQLQFPNGGYVTGEVADQLRFQPGSWAWILDNTLLSADRTQKPPDEDGILALSSHVTSSFALTATSTLGMGTTTLKFSGFPRATTFTKFGCTSMGSGTFVARLGDSVSSSTAVVSGTGLTTTFTTLSSNNAFTAGETVWIEIGSVSGTVANPSCSYQRTN